MSEAVTASDGLLIEFCEEAMELLEELPQQLSAFAESPAELEPLHLVFRCVHTIKGNAGFFGLPALKRFAHRLEDSLDALRQGGIDVEPGLVRSLIQAIDSLSEMITEIENGAPDASIEPHHEALLEEIERAISASQVGDDEQRILRTLLELADEMDRAEISQAQQWAEKLRELAPVSTPETPDAPIAGSDESLQTFAEGSYRCDDTDVTEDVRPLLALFLAAESEEDPRPLGDAFLQSCDRLIEIVNKSSRPDLAGKIEAVRQDFATLYSSPLDLDAMLLSVIWDRLVPVLTALLVTSSDEEPVEDKSPSNEVAEQTDQQNTPKKTATKNRFLRVKEEHVDTFLEDVSRLFITIERLKDLQQRMAERTARQGLVDELRQINATLSSQSTALQQSVVGLRRVPARELFAKFPRVARSLASKLEKQVDVHLDGEDVEIDKSLVEDLDGPLMHMVRNVCDHGIETPSEREARGMPAAGNLWMSCALTKSHVIITVRDDGRGIDPDRLRKKAVDSGWHTPESAAALSDQEAIELIFHPGMSTAAQVTDLSGRGVGLDVVRTRLREHDGDVKVTSRLGAGTTFRLEIPIRRAVVVIDGLLVREGQSTFVLPFESIREIARIEGKDLSFVSGRPVVRVRGEPYAARTLAELLGIKRHDQDEKRSSHDGVLVTYKQRTVFVMVESIIGQRKVVVGDLAKVLPQCDRLSGVAQLGAGRLALVVNPHELIRSANSHRATPN